MTHRIVVTDGGAAIAPGIELLRENGVAVDVLPGRDPEAKVAAARGADALLVLAEPLTAEQIDRVAAGGAVPGLAIRCGVGFDAIDVDAAARHGMRVANVPDYCTDEVADHALALLLAAERRLPHFLSSWRTSGIWDGSGNGLPVHRLADLTLGVVGAGRIGRAVAKRAQAFGMRVLAADPVPPPGLEMVPLANLLAQADVVTLHCPHNRQTEHLMNDGTFARMKVGSILVNTSRGPVVDSAALLRGLEREQPLVAALDVLEGEPTPDLSAPLLHHPRVLVTPHVAYYSRAAQRNVALFAARNILGFLRTGHADNVVNGVAG